MYGANSAFFATAMAPSSAPAAAAAAVGGLSWETMMTVFVLFLREGGKKAAFPKPGGECREAEGCKKALRGTGV